MTRNLFAAGRNPARSATKRAEWERLHNRLGVLLEMETATVSDAYREQYAAESAALWPAYVALCEALNPR